MLTVTDVNGCSSPQQSLTVEVSDALSASVIYPDTVCRGSEALITVSASGGDGNYQFSWSNGLSGPSNSITVTSDINITVTVTDGCTTPATQVAVAITAITAPAVSFNLPDQKGCVPLEAVFDVPAGLPSGMSYLWDFGNGFYSNQPSTSHIYSDPGIYTVSLSLAYHSAPGCSTTLQFPDIVNALDVPVARFIFDPPAPVRSKPEVFFTDRSTGAFRWSWDFGDGHYSNSQNPRHSYRDTGSFAVKLLVQTFDGCSDSTVGVVTVKDDIEIFIPNAFTPDGSGVNDYFQVYGVGIVSYRIEIFDRWGKIVHAANTRDKGWDGADRSTGKPVPQGLYVYKVTVTDNTGATHQRINQVTVLR
jgi:gliding motility-associated-like protein